MSLRSLDTLFSLLEAEEAGKTEKNENSEDLSHEENYIDKKRPVDNDIENKSNFAVKLSVIEVYNDKLRDLLLDDNNDNSDVNSLVDTSSKEKNLKYNEIRIHSASEGKNLILRCSSNNEESEVRNSDNDQYSNSHESINGSHSNDNECLHLVNKRISNRKSHLIVIAKVSCLFTTVLPFTVPLLFSFKIFLNHYSFVFIHLFCIILIINTKLYYCYFYLF